jgi:uncharacterized protein (TIGR03118 family)
MRRISAAAYAAAVVALLVAIAATSATAVRDNSYTVHLLVSDQAGQAPVQDPKLVNPWGLAASPTGGAAWVADNGTGVSTLYVNGGGAKAALEVSIPGGEPTGVVFNAGSESDFVVMSGAASGRAFFIFANESGLISGWNPAVPTVGSTIAVPAAQREGAIYTGLGIGSSGVSSFLYAADFHNARVDVFDEQFQLTTLAGSFSDPALPAGFAPFGIHTIGGRVYVTYAKQDPAAEDPVAGHGLGFVNVFDTNGNLIGRVAERGQLNAPWGIALAPADFGRASLDFLVGNIGDGKITAYEEVSSSLWEPSGQLRGARGRPLSIDGLRALGFGNGVTTGPANTLFFTAGPNDGTHGLFGSLTAD